jgi:uncharacterized membrane protein
VKIKLPNGLAIVYILTVFLVISVYFIPSSLINVILGIPFIFFFPGYTLVTALFNRKGEMDVLENLALSLGLSIAIVALIGFSLNFTSWGIRLEPVLLSIIGFIVLVSIIGLIRDVTSGRKKKLITEYTLSLSHGGGRRKISPLTVILIVLIAVASGIFGYSVVTPQAGSEFSEFYILGPDGKAQDYPVEFVMKDSLVVSVVYSTGRNDTSGGSGKVTLGIVNHQQKNESYSVKMKIDDKFTSINYKGTAVDRIKQIALQPGEKWETGIGFVPGHTGDNQKVEFQLFKGDSDIPDNLLNLWIKVR